MNNTVTPDFCTSKQAQADCQDAAITYERACQLHKGARDTIAVAEEKMMNNPGMFDSAWQEMLNNANARVSSVIWLHLHGPTF